jgi:hypothetical protein
MSYTLKYTGYVEKQICKLFTFFSELITTLCLGKIMFELFILRTAHRCNTNTLTQRMLKKEQLFIYSCCYRQDDNLFFEKLQFNELSLCSKWEIIQHIIDVKKRYVSHFNHVCRWKQFKLLSV